MTVTAHSPGKAVPRTVRVASVPAGHPYVRALDVPGTVVLPDPPVPGAPLGQWWPPVALDPDWVRDHGDDFDVLHLHFGTEGRTAGELTDWIDALAETGRPLVFTVHDLDHPHLVDQSQYAAQLAILLRAAAVTLTLTPTAAAEIRARWGVDARTVPHPPLAAEPWFAEADRIRALRVGAGPRIGVHLRSPRANVRADAWLGDVADAMEDLGRGTLQVFVNEDVAQSPQVERALDAIRSRAMVELHVRPRPDDDELSREIADLDVSVLPYSHGTHSGWLELCWDLGVRVLGPDVGHFAAQHPDGWCFQAFDAADPATIAPALRRALVAPSVPTAAQRLLHRRGQLRMLRTAHRRAYSDALQSTPVLGPA